MVGISVDEGGKVSDASFLSGFAELKEPSLDAVKHWSYRPYKLNGQPVSVKTKASIFYLGDGESFPLYVPDGSGGTIGGDRLPLPSGCNSGPEIKRQP